MTNVEVIIIEGREVGVDEIVPASIASKIVGLSERTVRDYAVKRLLPIYKIGNRNFFLVQDLLEYCESRRVEANRRRD